MSFKHCPMNVSPGPGSLDEHMRKVCRRKAGTYIPKLRSRGPKDLSCLCPASPFCDLPLSCCLTLQSHLSPFPTHAPLLCFEHTQLIVPAGCSTHAARPRYQCPPNLECPADFSFIPYVPDSFHAFRSQALPLCKCLLNYPNCALPSVLSFLCTVFLCTDIQY